MSQHMPLIAEYIWIDASYQIRSKCKTITNVDSITTLQQLPIWNFDGSSTGQAPGHDSEVLLHPVAYFPDPFMGNPHVLVLSQCRRADGSPAVGNHYEYAQEIFQTRMHQDPWYGIEQEYTMLESDGITPLGWPSSGFPAPQGPYYCGNGTQKIQGREIVQQHYLACLHAGLHISGTNAEVMLGQWEYQIGPCSGISSGHEVWLSRFLLLRVAEKHEVVISFDPKPIGGDWNGAGCHTNFSTIDIRDPLKGRAAIQNALENLEKTHLSHMEVYGLGNDRRMTGEHETSRPDQFTYGVADRGASVRIPRETDQNGYGYLEDRRPASSMDPYVVTAKIAETVVESL